MGEEHFNLLAYLQISVRDESLQCEKPSAAEMLHGTNESNLRKQVCTGVIFSCYRIPASNGMRTQLLKNWAALGKERRKKSTFFARLGLRSLRVAFSFLF